MIKYTKGNKAEGDLIVRVNGHQLTFKELAEICIQLCKNEDKIYPFPALGGTYLRNFLLECIDAREVTDAILNRYQLNAEINKIDICIFFAKINFSIKASFPFISRK